MSNIWKDYIDTMNNNNDPKQRFEKLLKQCSSMAAAIRETGITDTNRAELMGLLGLSIQLQTAIAILSKLDSME